MKKNLVLTGVLTALLVLTFFVQEKRSEKEYVRSLTEGRLIETEITSLKLPHIQAEKRNGQWWQGEQLLSHNIFKQIEMRLSQIKEIKPIDGNRSTYFSSPLEFEVNGEPWAIGDLSLDKLSFYVAKGPKISLAVIEGAAGSMATSEQELEERKIAELKGLLSKPAAEYRETQLFRYYPALPLSRAVIDIEGNLAFELDFEKNATLPPPIDGISVHEDLKSKFISLLTQAALKEELPYSESLKFKKMGEISFRGQDEKDKTVWELWLRSKDKADALIIDPQKKRSFLMIGGTLRVFFIHLQDYWDKKVIPPEEFVPFDRTEAVFTQGSKSARVTVINKEPLAFESPTRKVRPGSMQDLFQYLFNLGHRDQADRVSQLSKSERQQVLSEGHLRVSIMGQEIIFWRKQQELILVNLTQGFKAHFGLLNENLRVRFEDVLE